MNRFKRALDLALVAYATAGAVALFALAVAAPVRIGDGRLQAVVESLEAYDFKGLLVAALLGVWLVPLLLGLLWRQARAVGFEHTRLRAALEPLLNLTVPVKVDVDTHIPVRIEQPLLVPVEMNALIAIDEELEIEAMLPVRMEIPIDIEVETTVMRFGTIRVPVKANVPVDTILPIKGRIRVRTSLPLALREVARVQLPPFEVPLVARLETRIDVRANLRRGDGEPGPTDG